MARQLDVNGITYWILSEPHNDGWKSTVVEVKAGGTQEPVGIEATAETRTAADTAAEKKLRRLLQA